ncbi:MAG: UvrD-helicase domain-containing protein, partial [Methylococcales bacterium]
MLPADHEERLKTLEKCHIITDAGAGAGKTESLTQRFLSLLEVSSRPESVLAITFTNKAAGEMRLRIHGALDLAKNFPEPELDHEKLTWSLAKRVLARDVKEGWGLLENPNRLNIQTIDGFCSNITKHMPVLSQFGSQPSVADDVMELYSEASQNTLSMIEDCDNFADQVKALKKLLVHLDNNHSNIIDLFSTMLQTREQWMGYIQEANSLTSSDLRSLLESNLKKAVCDSIENLENTLKPDEGMLLSLAHFAGANSETSNELIYKLNGIKSLPSGFDEVGKWLAISELLFKKDGGIRAGASAAIGFPAPSSTKGEMK